MRSNAWFRAISLGSSQRSDSAGQEQRSEPRSTSQHIDHDRQLQPQQRPLPSSAPAMSAAQVAAVHDELVALLEEMRAARRVRHLTDGRTERGDAHAAVELQFFGVSL